MSEKRGPAGRRPHASPDARQGAARMSEHELALVRLAIAEDLPRGDATSLALFAPSTMAAAVIVAREEATIAGLAPAEAVFREIEPAIVFRAERADGSAIADGARVARGEQVVRIEGHALSILAAERTALNFLARLSGVATATRAVVDAVAGTGVHVLDTRKTTPGWRSLEKAAVRAGGGENHRMNASEMILIKDNHRALAGCVAACLARLSGEGGGRRPAPGLPVAVEAETLDDVRALVRAGVGRILLDNMSIEELRAAVEVARAGGASIFLEASGGIHEQNARAVSATGVDAISVGALTHSARAIDFSLEIVP